MAKGKSQLPQHPHPHMGILRKLQKTFRPEGDRSNPMINPHAVYSNPNDSHREGSMRSSSKLLLTSSLETERSTAEESTIPLQPHITLRVTFDTLLPLYLIGFNHSRPNDPHTFTRGRSAMSQLYQHHRYIENCMQRFCLGYDYYSVGLLLLEIALWEPLSDTKLLGREIKDVPFVELQDLWLSQIVPQLGPLVGRIYQEAVRVCLSNELLDVTDAEAKAGFETRVVKELLRCCA